MASKEIRRHPDIVPPHPGEFIREDVLPGLDMSKSEFAATLGISRQMLHGILTEKHAITAEMAVKLGHVLGNGPGIWMRLQQNYDLWHAERAVDTSKLRALYPAAKAA
jgi:addiction module HigA family antidote